MAQDCVFGTWDWTRELGVSVTASSEVAAMPASNLIDTRLGRRWRILATSGSVTIDLGATRSIEVLVAAQPWDAEDSSRDYTMLAASDLVRWELGSTSGAHDVYDSGWVACGIAPGYGLSALVLAQAYAARYVKFSFDATSYGTTGQTFADWGKIFISPALRRTYGSLPNYSDQWIDESAVEPAARSGVEFVDELQRYRRLSFSFDFLTEAEGRGTFKELLRTVGRRRQVFFTRDPDSTYLGTDAILGRFEAPGPIAHPSFERYAAQFVIRQSL